MRCLMYFKVWPIDNHRKYQLQQWTSPAKIWRSMTWWLSQKGVVLLTMIIKVSVENGGNEVLYHGIWDRKLFVYLPSGKHTKSYWKPPFIVDFPMKNGDFPCVYQRVFGIMFNMIWWIPSPEGTGWLKGKPPAPRMLHLPCCYCWNGTDKWRRSW